ncbi:helix-turn-helix domain-containing protein [Bifidobacterium samirii]|uniref:XRE family transcriptional regulator n=1 Tax=Bifidobacterium samirii TaxID=2306974 RepID=A0A430FV72_9BIFI|nr:helix-turn-helix transcriptional regulator [Bifidobacterium samirii]RSX57383.1 XRE family transcriptional regulator [Bifidobacterium samirii]
MKYVPTKVRRDLRTVGERFSQQRRLLSLTIADVAQRSGVSPTTVSNLEQGKAVRTDSLLSIARVLQLADAIVTACDPYLTDLGRLRADEQLPQRVRHKW